MKRLQLFLVGAGIVGVALVFSEWRLSQGKQRHTATESISPTASKIGFRSSVATVAERTHAQKAMDKNEVGEVLPNRTVPLAPSPLVS